MPTHTARTDIGGFKAAWAEPNGPRDDSNSAVPADDVPPIRTARLELVSMTVPFLEALGRGDVEASLGRDRCGGPALAARAARALRPVPARDAPGEPLRPAVARARPRPDGGGRHAPGDRHGRLPCSARRGGSRGDRLPGRSRLSAAGLRARSRARDVRLGGGPWRPPLRRLDLARQQGVAVPRRQARLPSESASRSTTSTASSTCSRPPGLREATEDRPPRVRGAAPPAAPCPAQLETAGDARQGVVDSEVDAGDDEVRLGGVAVEQSGSSERIRQARSRPRSTRVTCP